MKTYLGNEIRNLAFVGHSHCGKTTLIEALLATAGTIPAMGSVEDGTAVTAYDEEEVTRRVTLANAVAFCEWSGVKVNVIDTPGFNMFVPEARSAMLPVEAVAVVVDAVEGPQPMTQRVWDYAEEFKLPRILSLMRWTANGPSRTLYLRICAQHSDERSRRSRCRLEKEHHFRASWT